MAISATPVELREIKLAAKPEAMLAASPKATVPILVLPDGNVIDQSIDIMYWALARHDPEAWLDRDDPALIAANDGPFKYALDRYKYPERHGSHLETHRMNGLAFLQQIEDQLGTAANLRGASPGLADAAIIPFVRQFAAVDPEWFARQQLARVKLWLSSYLSSDLYDAIMLRLPIWSPLDAPVTVDWRRQMDQILPKAK